MNKQNQERKIHFIDKKFQVRFIFRFCELVAIGGLLTIGILYLLSWQSTTVSIVNSRAVVRTTADFLLPLLIQTMLIVLIVVSLATILLVVIFSHKIAGPLFRLRKAMEGLASGNFQQDFRIRNDDQLQNIAETFNSTIATIREIIVNIKLDIISLKQKIEDIREEDLPEYKRAALSELKKAADNLLGAVNYFKS